MRDACKQDKQQAMQGGSQGDLRVWIGGDTSNKYTTDRALTNAGVGGDELTWIKRSAGTRSQARDFELSGRLERTTGRESGKQISGLAQTVTGIQ